MADDMITSPIGQDMAQTAQQGAQALQQQPPAGEGQVAPQQDPSTQVAQNNVSPQQRPKGTVQDQREAILKRDPHAKLPATKNMQDQYVQLVTRFLLYIDDLRMRPSQNGQKGTHSPAETFINQMNNPKLSVDVAVGRATANALFILHNSAKQQHVSYNPNVMFRAADECVIAMYLLGSARGIFNGVPAFKGKEPGVPYKFDDSEKMLIMKAKIAAVQWFGNLMEKSGQITPQDRQAALQHFQNQIRQEVAEGKVTDNQVQAIMQKTHFADQLDQGGPSPNNPSIDNSTGASPPPQQQQQPPQQQGAQ